MHYKEVIVFVLLMGTISACSLGANEEPLAAPESTEIIVSTALPTALPTQTPSLTSPTSDPAADQGILTPAPAADNTVTGNDMSTCTPRTDWTAYTVVTGDTLAAIARQADSTTAELIAANCLTDPNLLNVGQILYVPTTVGSGDDGTDPIVTNPMLYVNNNGAIVLFAGESVALWWAGAPLDVGTEVEFSLTRTGSTTAESLGIDKDMTDDARIFWTVPANMCGTLIASARLPGQDHYSVTSSPTAVCSRVTNDMPIDTGQIVVDPIVRKEANWIVVQAGGTVTLTWEGAPRDVFSIDFLLAPTGTGSTYSVIGTDTNPADGASISWHIPGGFTGHLTARANMHNLSAARLTKEIEIYAEE